MKRLLLLILLAIVSFSAAAQVITDSAYRTIGHVKSDGTVQDVSYRTVGHAKGIPMSWGAVYFFFNFK